MAAHPFLSDGWIDAARAIRDEYRGRTPAVPFVARVNLVITEVPFADSLHAHVDTGSGELEIETGHLPEPDLTLTLDYPTAKALLVEGDAQSGMQAYLGGRIQVQGDISRLVALQGQAATADPVALEMAGRIREITE